MEVRRCDSCGKDIPKGTPYLRVTSENADLWHNVERPFMKTDFCDPKCLHAFMCNYVSRL